MAIRTAFLKMTGAADKKKIFWYFLFPLLVAGALMAMFFSGVPLLETIVAAPYFEAMPMNSRREFGLLENLQHLMLLVACVMAIRYFFKARAPWIRLFMAFVALGTFVLFLEEIDYGLHYYEYLAEIPHDQVFEVRNFHNVSNRTALLKSAADAGMILVFGLAPFALVGIRNERIRFFVPDRYMALLLIASLLTRATARFLHGQGLGVGLGLDSNLSEFRELITYYMGLVYLLYLGRRLDTPVADDSQYSDRGD